MRAFSSCRHGISISGFQRHHIIPLEVVRNPCFSKIFDRVRQAGFDPYDFTCNGIYLPATEALAIQFKLAMHRGPHRRYTEMVCEWVAAIDPDGRRDPLELMALLQIILRRMRRYLEKRPSNIYLNRFDPLWMQCGLGAVENPSFELADDLHLT